MSAEDIAIRPAGLKDVPELLRLIRALAEYERLSDYVTATETLLREALFGPHPAAEAVLAKADDAAVGFAVFFHNFSTFVGKAGLYLEDLFVVPERRGQGIGRRLLNHVANVAVARGCERLEWAVLDWNTPAVGFYQRLGAMGLDDWTVNRLAGEALKRFARGED